MKGTQRNQCTVKVGLFVQKNCGKPTAHRCSHSHKPICQECAVEVEGKIIAKDIYAQMRKERGERPEYLISNNDNYFWYFYYREQFYNNYHFEPFDEFDEQGFESQTPISWDEDSNAQGQFDS